MAEPGTFINIANTARAATTNTIGNTTTPQQQNNLFDTRLTELIKSGRESATQNEMNRRTNNRSNEHNNRQEPIPQTNQSGNVIEIIDRGET